MVQNQRIELIELYRDYEVLWNAKFKDYHNRNKKEDAWKDISAQMNIPVDILKAKMKSLSGTFRSEKSRETKKTTGSGEFKFKKKKPYNYNIRININLIVFNILYLQVLTTSTCRNGLHTNILIFYQIKILRGKQ